MVYYCDLCIHLHNYIQLHIQTHKKHPALNTLIDSDMYKKVIMTKYIQRVFQYNIVM